MRPDRINQYRVVSELGKGSMGIVYEGVPDSGGPSVAIKVFYPDTMLSVDETGVLRDRFEREGRSLTQIDHANVVHVIEVGEEGNIEYIVMEKLEGFDLKQLLEMGTRFTLGETLDIMDQLLAGLAVCHRLRVVHRDIKPANVVRSPQGVIKLTDFGIARIVTDQTLSRAGTIVGTPNYMSPEQIRGEDVDARTDLFSAGVLMYELLTGKKPFDGPDMTSIMYNVANIQPPSARFYNGSLPSEIDGIMNRALSKTVDARFQSADEFSEALRNFERDMQYRNDTESVLSALPSAPDPDSGLSAVIPSSAIPPGVGASPGSLAGSVQAHGGSMAFPGGLSVGASGIQQGIIYCLYCGMNNDEMGEFCTRCMRPLVKPDMITHIAAQQAKIIYKVKRADYLFLSCLSLVMASVVILILYLFLRGVA